MRFEGYHETGAPVVVHESQRSLEQYVRSLRDQLLASGQRVTTEETDVRRFDLCIVPDRFRDDCAASMHSMIGIAIGPGPNELTLELLDGVFGQHHCEYPPRPRHNRAVFRVDPTEPLQVVENNCRNDLEWYVPVLFSAVKYFVIGQDPKGVYPVGVVELDPAASLTASYYDLDLQQEVTFAPVLIAADIVRSADQLSGHVLRDLGSLVTECAVEINRRHSSDTDI